MRCRSVTILECSFLPTRTPSRTSCRSFVAIVTNRSESC
jgi:hypothetical protein